MTLFTRISKDDPHTVYKMSIDMPKIGRVNSYNEWSDELYRGFELNMDTNVSYIHCDGYWCFTFTVLGFGFHINKQTGY